MFVTPKMCSSTTLLKPRVADSSSTVSKADIDYDRYDHTYCRILKEGEEISIHKPVSVTVHPSDNIPPLYQSQMSIEKENGTSPNHEPVIIVRTKRLRKTAPIIVKAYSSDPDAVQITTAPTTSSTAHKNKLVHPVIQKPVTASPPSDKQDIVSPPVLPVTSPSNEESTSEVVVVAKPVPQQPQLAPEQQPKPVQQQPKPVQQQPKPAPQVTVVNNTKPTKTGRPRKQVNKIREESILSIKEEIAAVAEIKPTEVMETTKSGRQRKLTAKAKQNNEESRKLNNKSPKGAKKALSGKGSGSTRQRGRPPKKSDGKTTDRKEVEAPSSGEGTVAAVQSAKVGDGQVAATPMDEPQTSGKGDGPPEAQSSTSSKSEKESATESPTDETTVSKPSTLTKKTNLKRAAVTQPKPDSPSKRSRKQPAAKNSKNTSKNSTTNQGSKSQPAAGKRNSKKATKSKLVVRTKLPPKRRAVEEKKRRAMEEKKGANNSAKDHSIPAAKIDLNNIVTCSRRRK